MDLATMNLSLPEESSCSDSSGPTTPIFSPVVRPLTERTEFNSSTDRFFSIDMPRLRNTRSVSSESSVSDYATRKVESICFIGAGYVGGPTAAMIALHNPDIRVEVVDRDAKRIARWNSKHLPIHEPGLSEVVRIARDGALVERRCTDLDTSSLSSGLSWSRAPNLFFSTDVAHSIAKADMIFLAVNTSTKMFGIGAGKATDMSALDSAVHEIAKNAASGAIIVEKSTVPCGTADRIRRNFRSSRPDSMLEVLSNPEFLAEGTAIQDLMKPDRVVIGSLQTRTGIEAASHLADLYSNWVPRSRILTQNVWSSELSKLVANAILAQRISSINSISAICERTGADISEVAHSIGLDTRIGSKFLKAGIGFGGSCFRKDIASLTYIAESLGLDDVAEYWTQVIKMNVSQRLRFTRKIIRCLGDSLPGKKIAILGFAFKANTGDPRESVVADMIEELLQERPAEIAIFDPYCRQDDIVRELHSRYPEKSCSAVKVYGAASQACAGADAIVVANDCSEFKVRNKIEMIFEKACKSKPTAVAVAAAECAEEERAIFSEISANLSFVLKEIPACDANLGECNECAADWLSEESARNPCLEQCVDWEDILSNMRAPRWIFDGRNILNTTALEQFGITFNLEAVGRMSTNVTDGSFLR